MCTENAFVIHEGKRIFWLSQTHAFCCCCCCYSTLCHHSNGNKNIIPETHIFRYSKTIFFSSLTERMRMRSLFHHDTTVKNPWKEMNELSDKNHSKGDKICANSICVCVPYTWRVYILHPIVLIRANVHKLTMKLFFFFCFRTSFCQHFAP